MSPEPFPGPGDPERVVADRRVPRGAEPRAEPPDDRFVPLGPAIRSVADLQAALRRDLEGPPRARPRLEAQRSASFSFADFPSVVRFLDGDEGSTWNTPGLAAQARVVHGRGALGRRGRVPHAEGAPPDPPSVRAHVPADRDRAGDVGLVQGDARVDPGERATRREAADDPVPPVHAGDPERIYLDPEAADQLWWYLLEYLSPDSRLENDILDNKQILAGLGFACAASTVRPRQGAQEDRSEGPVEPAVPRAATDRRASVRPGRREGREAPAPGPERAPRDLRARGPADDDAVHRMGARGGRGDDGAHAEPRQGEGARRGPARVQVGDPEHQVPAGEGVWTEWDDGPQAPPDPADVVTGFDSWHRRARP